MDIPKYNYSFIISITGLLILAYLLVISAWICEDAYITFRTIDNFINGYGLRWNISERVQTFTHPFWMLLITGLYWFTHEFFFSVTIFSLILSLIAVLIIVHGISRSQYTAIMALAALLCSKAFIDYTSSGLESPLSFLLLAIFLSLYFKYEFNSKAFFWLTFVAALSIFNRMDTGLLFLFPLLHFGYRTLKDTKASLPNLLKFACLGFIPLFGWVLFSTVYYGFPFPNTAYAKLNTGIPLASLADQGFLYLKNSFINDTVTLVIVATAVFFSFFQKNARNIAASLGLFAYICYTVRIGGDFMSGRFLAVPFFGAVCILSQIKLKRMTCLLLTILFLVLGISVNNPTFRYNKNYQNMEIVDGIADERGFYYQQSGMLNVIGRSDGPIHLWRFQGQAAKDLDKRYVIVRKNVGFFAFYAGPNIHVIDELALCDPLLSRMEIPDKSNWRIGHFRRNIPKGYPQSIATNKAVIEDANVNEFYSLLDIVTQEDLWSLERLKIAIKINSGLYDRLLKISYLD